MNYIHGREQSLRALRDSSLPLIMLGHGRMAFVLERYLKNKKINVSGYVSDYESDRSGGGVFNK